MPKPPEAVRPGAPVPGIEPDPGGDRGPDLGRAPSPAPSALSPGSGDPAPAEHALDLEQSPAKALAAVAGAAEGWGADWQPAAGGGRLALPILAGIRHGLVTGHVRVEGRSGGGSRVRFQPEETLYRVHAPSVAILVLAAAGALLTVIWPFFPALLAAAPFGAVIALAGWFLVVSRLRTNGPGDFLELVEELAAGGGPEAGGSEQ